MRKVLLLMLGCNSAFAADNFGFVFENEAINPACVAMFNASVADYPYINAINLNECQHSNAAYQTTLSKGNSYYFYQNNKNYDEGMYSYNVVGKTSNNIFVLDTTYSGGGTLVASELLLVRLSEVTQHVYDGTNLKVQHNTEMKLLGYVIGGDRCVGAFAEVKVDKNKLFIKQYNDQMAGGECKKTKSYSLDLEGL